MGDKYGKVAVLMGGASAEREISLQSGRAVLAALRRCKVDAQPIDTHENFPDALHALKPNCAFVALHGRGGEDGVIQGFLEVLGIPYTGSGVQGAALTMDKYRTKLIWRGMGLPTPDSLLLSIESDWKQIVEMLGLPLMVKPVREGSSVGMSLVQTADDLKKAFQVAYRYDMAVLAEEYIIGAEYSAAILNDKTLPLIRLETPRTFYDFAAKYTETSTRCHCPCGLERKVEENLQRLVLTAFQATGATGWGRVDFMLDKANHPWLLEVNTIPGMTDHSLMPMAARVAGIEFDELVLKILDTAWC